MNEYITELLRRYGRAGALLDTNVLLLYFVGLFDPELIPVFKRTKMFTVEDYSTLVAILNHFKRIVTTPNILTEVSNFSGQLPEHLKHDYFEKFASGITLLDEHYLRSDEISEMRAFKRFGLTDAGIIHLVKDNYLIITANFKLAQYLQKEGVDALNFNYIRIINW